jgi:hypothetical protein
MHKFYYNHVGENVMSRIKIYHKTILTLFWHISCRYIAAQKYSEALDILESGALVQLKHGQVTFSL